MTRPTAKTPQQPRGAHLAGVGVHANLGELRAKGVHREALRFGAPPDCSVDRQIEPRQAVRGAAVGHPGLTPVPDAQVSV